MSTPDVSALRHRSELDGRTFLLGLGGMKCASSWVYHYLEQVPGVTVSPIKELHFFNARLRPPGHVPFTPMILGVVRDYLQDPAEAARQIRVNPHFQASVDCLRMLHDDNAYFDLFARVCTPDTRALGEITPQYGVLGEDGFRFVRAFFGTQRMRLRPFVVLRDPVARLWSHLRHLQQAGEAGDIVSQWPELIRQRGVIERSDYWKMIEALDAVFPDGDVLYLFYEDLFSGAALARLCEAGGVAYVPPPDDLRRNETAVQIPLPDPVRAQLRRLLAPQYGFCRDRFGADLPDAWAV